MINEFKMNAYVQHVGLTAWRRKTTLLLGSGLLLLVIFGLEYTKDSEKDSMKINEFPNLIAQTIMDSASKVKFVDNKKPEAVTRRPSASSYSENKRNGGMQNDAPGRQRQAQIEQELGIPNVNLNSLHPYVPKHRIVHFDLKGAPPLISFFRRFFPFLKNLGATGILMEYEDMFPFDGKLSHIRAKNSYSKEDIGTILNLAKDNNLELIPLIQTFGHMEFALKHAQFSDLREVPGSPQALCPSRNASMDLIREIVTQVMALHPGINYLHIGCDEVYQMGECDICRLEIHEDLFLKHTKKVASYVLENYPSIRVIVWDDMLRHIPQHTLVDLEIAKYVEPMIWVYAEDIYRFVQPPVWDKYAAVFDTAWTASAFKGAFGETLYVPDARRHLENNLRWLDVMSQQSVSFKKGFRGLVLTGWQRYDHFAVLCELLAAGIPSLALSLTAVSHGYFNSSLRYKVLSGLSCPQHQAMNRDIPFIALEIDPFLWEKLGRCMFPGSQFFRLTYRLHSAESEAEEFLKTAKRNKGWMTDYNVRHNYSLPLRIDEILTDLPHIYHNMLNLMKAAFDSMIGVYDNYTKTEWIEQKIYPYIVQLERIQNQSMIMKSVSKWQARPLPPLKDLERLGIQVPQD